MKEVIYIKYLEEVFSKQSAINHFNSNFTYYYELAYISYDRGYYIIQALLKPQYKGGEKPMTNLRAQISGIDLHNCSIDSLRIHLAILKSIDHFLDEKIQFVIEAILDAERVLKERLREEKQLELKRLKLEHAALLSRTEKRKNIEDRISELEKDLE